jgi:hypothetical protein
MADAWSYLPGATGDAYTRMHGTTGDAWARLPGTVDDAWTRLIASVGPVFALTEIIDEYSMIQILLDVES